MSISPQFDPARFQDALITRSIGRFLVYRNVVETTMTLARREADEGAPHGTLLLAEEQTAGRGRRGRTFHSPAGQNLYFTLVLRLSLDALRALPVVLPVALARALCAEGVDARIKWPNDIWVGELKLSGMLIDSEVGPEGAVAFPGIGINVNGDPGQNPELAGIATSLKQQLGRSVDRERLLARICNELESMVAAPMSEAIAGYRERSLILGRMVTVHPAATPSFEAQAVAILEDGALLVRRGDGSEETVTAADVSVRPASPRPLQAKTSPSCRTE
jgi:BirA family transcriptional regulator, biotin operon repressor / biotin---[acetyl-CoA-carboxylase] ligase